jgi:hypothetical protein
VFVGVSVGVTVGVGVFVGVSVGVSVLVTVGVGVTDKQHSFIVWINEEKDGAVMLLFL